MSRSAFGFSLILSSLLALAAPASAAEAHAILKSGDGKAVGKVTLEDTGDGVLLKAAFEGLPSGVHAFHVHAVGKCEPPFQTAQGHFNPTGKQHGYLNANGPHAGDMPDIHVPDSGKLTVEVFLPNVTIDKGAARLLDDDGAALMIHAGPDDYKSDPAGNAGDRVACGIIEQ